MNLNEPANAQYDEWKGTLAADCVMEYPIERLLGVDAEQWRIVIVDISIDGGWQWTTAYAIPAATEYPALREMVESGRLEVTKVAHFDETPHDHHDTVPPAPPVLPVTWASNLLAIGFKRLHIRMSSLVEELRALPLEIVEVASIVDESGE